jgi:hypothetical protein
MKLLLPVLMLVFLLASGRAVAADDDLQFWFPVQVVHPFGDSWTVSMQAEVRLQDDISEFDELVLKPALNYHFNEHWALSLGYKYIDKYDASNEHDIWQELHYNWACKKWSGGHQVRLEERIIDGIDGVLPRIRFLSHIAHPLGDSDWYGTGWGAVRFNLDDKVDSSGGGPVSGFEQVRLFAGLGKHLGENTKAEFGYLYRYERERTSPNKSDHVIHLQMVFHTDGGLLKRLRGLLPYR